MGECVEGEGDSNRVTSARVHAGICDSTVINPHIGPLTSPLSLSRSLMVPSFPLRFTVVPK